MSAPNVPPQVPAPAPMPPAAAAPSTELPRHHVHHSYIWLESVRTIFIIAVCVVVANFSTIIGLVAEEGMGAEAGFIMAVAGIGTLVVILITFGIVAGLRVVGYKHLYFTVGPDEFTLCSGIFNKKQVHVPYQRVQSVDQRATLLQRLFGVCTVSIDTAGGAANKAVVVPYVTKAQAEWLRAELYNRKNALAAQAAVASGMAGAASATATGMAGAGDPIPQSVGAGIAAMAQGAATFAGNVPSPAAAATCSMWAPRHGTKWAACSPALLRIPAALPTSTVSLTRSCSSRVFPTPHRWGSSSPVWLSACCKSSVSSST